MWTLSGGCTTKGRACILSSLYRQSKKCGQSERGVYIDTTKLSPMPDATAKAEKPQLTRSRGLLLAAAIVLTQFVQVRLNPTMSSPGF